MHHNGFARRPRFSHRTLFAAQASPYFRQVEFFLKPEIVLVRIRFLALCLGPACAFAQATPLTGRAGWAGGLGLGNGVEAHGGYFSPQLMAFGRVRGKWWGPSSGPKPSIWGEDINTRSRQTEVAGLVGYPVAAGRTLFYAATGLAYVNGRQLGDYRFSLRSSGVVSEVTHYYAYSDYQALGLPVEVGALSPPLGGGNSLRLGVSGQANFNPKQTVYCLLLTLWVGPGLKPRPLP